MVLLILSILTLAPTTRSPVLLVPLQAVQCKVVGALSVRPNLSAFRKESCLPQRPSLPAYLQNCRENSCRLLLVLQPEVVRELSAAPPVERAL